MANLISKIIFPYGEKKAAKLVAGRTGKFEDEFNGGVIVCAVQYKIKPLPSLKRWVADVEDIFIGAKRKGAKAIAFPEFFSVTPLSAMPLTRGVFKVPNEKKKTQRQTPSNEPIELKDLRKLPKINDKFTFNILKNLNNLGEFTNYVLAHFAKEYKMIVATGSALEYRDGKLFNTQTLFDEQGREIGKQDKMHPMDMELDLGISYGESANVFDTSIGKIAIPICMDASYFETFKILKNKGAQIVLMGICNMEEYQESLATRGLSLRVSEYYMYGVKSAMTGYASGNIITGYAEIVAPCEITRGGVIKRSESYLGTDLIYSEIDLSKLKFRSKYRAADNERAINKLLKKVY